MRALILVSLTVFLLAPTAASAKSRTDTTAGRATSDRKGDGAADIVSARLTQQGHNLTVWLGLAEAPDPAMFSRANGGRICVWLSVRAHRQSHCADTVNGAWKLDGGEVLPAGKRRLGLRFSDVAGALRPGRVQWWVTATAAGCEVGAEAGAVPCVDRAPDGRKRIAGRVYTVKPIGCTRRGPEKVFKGPNRRRIALTFDDGPSGYTASILDLLKAHDQHATFFELGSQVRTAKGRADARRVLREGNELANHSYTHANLGSGGPRATDELTRTNAAIRQATGFTPCLFRPPYGSTGSDLESRARALGMTSVIWSIDTSDYRRRGVGSISAQIRAARSGSIILMHDGGGDRSQTVGAVAATIASLSKRFELVTVSELLGYRQDVKLVH